MSSPESTGNPVPDVSWNIDRHAEEIQREIVTELGGEVQQTTHSTPSPGGHHVGTTRMGTDPAESVVGPRLRTHDVDNLTIASSSVFVTGGAADYLRSDL